MRRRHPNKHLGTLLACRKAYFLHVIGLARRNAAQFERRHALVSPFSVTQKKSRLGLRVGPGMRGWMEMWDVAVCCLNPMSVISRVEVADYESGLMESCPECGFESLQGSCC
ncbi:uncharacterized protein ARMOST_02631 [Armillaria ostoyae]|uniref:Uncharacterized protein n=1 Tax=Armillaria ostoyae TaxID=47428 RepID=A0A284QS77_ARMOS|nr:uncharacterized protein ARMOST_02631 [Armillaria ostoyae]